MKTFNSMKSMKSLRGVLKQLRIDPTITEGVFEFERIELFKQN